MNWKIKNENKGFTLIELLLSVLILAFVVAPFLSSFLIAGDTNISSKKKQEATDIAQLLAEEFKATDFHRLISDKGYPVETYNIEDEDGNETGEIGYRFTLENDDLPDTYAAPYNAVITLEPSDSNVNDKVTPVINNADSDAMAVYLSNFYTHDNEAGTEAKSRECTVKISLGYTAELEPIYYVKLLIRYFDDYGNKVYEVSDSFGQLNYLNGKPEIYLMYTPLSMTGDDKIVIDNTISPGLLVDDSGEQIKINVYLAMQNINDFRILNPYLVTILSANESGTEAAETTSLGQLQAEAMSEGINSSETKTTRIYTNVVPVDFSVDPPIKQNLVELTKKETLYDMKIIVNYNENKVSTVNSAKNISDKGDVE